MSAKIAVLSPLRFRCTACGACCQGGQVALEDDEPARLVALAELLGVPEPIADGHLRMEGGRCVFLAEDQKCLIHARLGATAKPLVCQQFPFVLVQTESGMRAGVDPMSFHLLDDWETAPPFDDAVGKPRRSHLEPGDVRAEAAIVAWCSAPGATVGAVLARLCGTEPAGGLPDGFAGRLITRLRAMHLDVLLQARDAGPQHVAALRPLVERLESLDPAAPPPWPALAAREDAFAVEVCRRMVWLRLATRIPVVQGVALLTLAGAVALAWVDPQPSRFGPALATWVRLLRAGTFWQSLTPTPADMQWLARG